MNNLDIEGWKNSKRILVILAHPDDPEFFCGATLNRWTKMGHSVRYCLLTRGDKGSDDPEMTPERLAEIRIREQRAAAAVLGVQNVRFLEYPDGELVCNLETRAAVARVIREEKPDILVTCDPMNWYPFANRINHPDHLAAGQIVLHGYFPGAGNRMYHPELLSEGLTPHSVEEIWLSSPFQPNLTIDVTQEWPTKIRALFEHKSQIGDPALLEKRMLSRRTEDSTDEHPRFEEKFHRFILG